MIISFDHQRIIRNYFFKIWHFFIFSSDRSNEQDKFLLKINNFGSMIIKIISIMIFFTSNFFSFFLLYQRENNEWITIEDQRKMFLFHYLLVLLLLLMKCHCLISPFGKNPFVKIHQDGIWRLDDSIKLTCHMNMDSQTTQTFLHQMRKQICSSLNDLT